jgi:6-pyruvoyltetrahydropterin/6-carboxytetrahydropterin synthase
MKYYSKKHYDHNQGLSCTFRQWKATHSHCEKLHGYSLAITFEFSTDELDHRNWCLDFGGMKQIKQWLSDLLDHTTLIDQDDPHLDEFKRLDNMSIINLRVMPGVGCEKFAEFIFTYVENWVEEQTKGRVNLEKVTVAEHTGNSASVTN